MDELREIITSGEESYSIDDVQRIIKDTFGVNHDYKTVWTKDCSEQCKNPHCKNIKYKSNIFKTILPDLNPIKYVWIVIKKTIYKTTYDTTKELVNLFEEKFYEIIESKAFYENWL